MRTGAKKAKRCKNLLSLRIKAGGMHLDNENDNKNRAALRQIWNLGTMKLGYL